MELAIDRSLKRHFMHVTCFILFFIVSELFSGGIRLWDSGALQQSTLDPVKDYGLGITILLYTFRLITLLPVPLCVGHACGLLVYNIYSKAGSLNVSPLAAPFICIRVVTRGDFPELIRQNVQRNINTCLDLGLVKFIIEVVTDKHIVLPDNPRVRLIVVPSDYRTKTNSLYKSRALQYALEGEINILNDMDWIVHLDEETLLTESSIYGIINFIVDGKHHIGQGMVTYANEHVVNWITTLADSYRVGVDLGLLRFTLRKFHRPLCIFKGSFVVCQAGVERKVSFDNGLEGSIAEDTYFALSAMSQGYTFDWVEGEMWEKSPFTFWDFLQQRKRWLQGIFLVVHDKKLPFKVRFGVGLTLYSWMSLPLCTLNVFLMYFYPLPVGQLADFLGCLVTTVSIYLYLIGAAKSFSARRLGYLRYASCILGAICTIPFVAFIENISVIWGLFGNKNNFYVVQKSGPSVLSQAVLVV